MRLVIFSSVPHFGQEKIAAHSGFVREVNVWATLFDEILIIGIHGTGQPREDAIPYASDNVHFVWLNKAIITDGVIGKLLLLSRYPLWFIKSLKHLTKDDVLMARGPDSVGFLGGLIGMFTGRPHFAKYADQWKNFLEEPKGYRIQKMLYRSKLFGGPVQIYGSADPDRPHLIPFFTSSVSLADWQTAGEMIANRVFTTPFRMLFVGRLVKAKGVDVILKALQTLRQSGCDVVLDIVGDGPELAYLKNYAEQLRISPYVAFSGMLGWHDLMEKYAISHCFIHASRKEGFGKVLIEAMTFGLPIIGTDVGVSCALLSPPHFGILVPPEDPDAIAVQVKNMMQNYQVFLEVGYSARCHVKQFLLENVKHQYKDFIKTALNIERET